MTTPAGSTRILLVERADGESRALAEPLAEAGYEVERVTSEGPAISQIEAGGVDGVVSEHDPPALDGLGLLRSTRIGNPTLPFVLAPSNGSEVIAGDAIAAGVSGYVPASAGADTVRRRFEAALRTQRPPERTESVERYHHLVETSPVAINVFEADGSIIWGNDAVLDLLGMEEREELVGRSIFEFIHEDDRETARRELEMVTGEKSSVGPTEMRLNPLDADVRHISVATAIGDLLGASIGQAIAVDVTDRTIQRRHLGVLDTWLRHNIRNELNLIQGVAERLRQREDPSATADAEAILAGADRLLRQADRQRRLIRLLESPPDPLPIDLGSLLERQVEGARAEFPDAAISLESVEAASCIGIPELEPAVGEVIDNAIEHSETSSPTVTISLNVSDTDDVAVLEITDEGPGIPQGELELLRPTDDVDQLHHGSGLGLIFVYWVVELSGGSIDFDTDGDRGTTVTIRLPLTEAE